MRSADITTVRILGVIDNLGYLYCEECRDITDYDNDYVWSDQTAHVDEACDQCGRVLSEVARGKEGAAA